MPPCAPLTLALYEPDIAPNAGAMLRTCACFAADAAIIEPAGFVVDRPALRRAGMDYLDALPIARHASFARFEAWRAAAGRRLVLLTTKGETALWDFAFRPGDVVLVGRESAGVPDSVARRGRRARPHPDRAAAALAQRRRRRGAGARRGAPTARRVLAAPAGRDKAGRVAR